MTFIFYGSADDIKAHNKLFEGFRKKYPNIDLKAQGIAARSWADFANTVATRIAGGQAIDMVQIATGGQRIFASKDLCLPLDDYIKAD